MKLHERTIRAIKNEIGRLEDDVARFERQAAYTQLDSVTQDHVHALSWAAAAMRADLRKLEGVKE